LSAQSASSKKIANLIYNANELTATQLVLASRLDLLMSRYWEEKDLEKTRDMGLKSESRSTSSFENVLTAV
jgi:hypothetical protein